MNRVFKWLTSEGNPEDAKANTAWFARAFEPNNFTGVERLMCCYLRFCSKLGIAPSKAFLSSYLQIDAKQDIKKYNIKTETMSAYDYREASQLAEATQIISEVAQSTYDVYLSEDLTNRDFKVDIYGFMNAKKADSITNAMLSIYPKLTDGSDVTEVSSDLRSSLSDIDEIYDVTKIRDIDLDNSGSDEVEMKFLCKTGVPCIDGDIGGIYTRLITTVNAQPGGGKSRFTYVHYVYPVLTQAKKDVIIWSNELTESQIKNILIAYHITKVYGGRIKIPDSIMNKKHEMSPEQLQIYESAKIDLFESGNYGRLIVREETVVERYRDEAESLIKKSGNTGLIVIDYMGLIESRPESKWDKHLDQYEVITKGYEITRRLLKKIDISAVCINQYNDKGIDAAYSGKPIRSGHVQGGHIVQRHTDYDISITFTEEQKLAQVRSMSTSKTRGTSGFSNVLFSTDLSVSIFRQELTS